MVLSALAVLHAYRITWKITYSLNKTAVLAIRPDENAPEEWPMGEDIIRSSSVEKYLSNTITGTGDWSDHLTAKLKSASRSFNMVRAAGLLGGDMCIQQSAHIATTVIWPSLDSGRVAVNLFGQPESQRKLFDDFRLKVGRHILSVSKGAPHAGILGELGWIPDIIQGDIQHIKLLHRLLAAPDHTLPRKFADGLVTLLQNPDANLPPFLSQALALITLQPVEPANAFKPGWLPRTITCIKEVARKNWVHTLQGHNSLLLSYPANPKLQMQFYLTLPSFKGRTLLTKYRLNDLISPIHRTPTTTCRHCEAECPGSIDHILFLCPALTQVRQHHAQNLHILTVAPLTIVERHRRLLLATRPLNRDIQHIHHVGAYLHDVHHSHVAPT
jgi:hypothetical protein